MSKYNQCERGHGDIDGFFAAIAEEGEALRIADALGATRIDRLSRTLTIVDLVTGCIPVATDFVSLRECPENKDLLACARAIIANECAQFQLVEHDSLATFEIVAKGDS